MNILFYYHLTKEFPEEFEHFRSQFTHESIFEVHTSEEYEQLLPTADIIICGRISESQIEMAENLKVLFIPFTGVNTLPFKNLRDRAIVVSNNHGNSAIVAERAVALALAITARVCEFDRDLRKGYWHIHRDRKPIFDYWTSIQGKEVTILGTGSIGQNIARLLSGFNCRITGFRRSSSKTVPEYFDLITSSLPEAINRGMLIFVALPLTSETENLISMNELRQMENKFLINISRGMIVNEENLFTALQSGLLAGAAIDAWYQYTSKSSPELLPSKYDFHTLDNIVMSPHAASHTVEGKIGQFMGCIEDLTAYITSGSVPHKVDLEEGY